MPNARRAGGATRNRFPSVSASTETSFSDLKLAPFGWAHLHPIPADTGVSGVDQRWETLGAAAVDMVVREVNVHRMGIPPEPLTLTAEGRWVDGRTTRPRRPAETSAEPAENA